MSWRAHDQHPFRPGLVALWSTTGPLKLIPLGREHLVTTVIGAENLFQLTSLVFREPLGDPGVHGISRRPSQRQGRQVQVVVPRKGRADLQRTHLLGFY